MTATPEGITYASYLALDELLGAQHPISDHHDELLFIIIHQTKELWLKQMLHEVALATALIADGQFAPAHKALSRVSRIQTVMTLSWDILSTHLLGVPVGAVPRTGIPAGHEGRALPQAQGRRGGRTEEARSRAGRAEPVGSRDRRARPRRLRRFE
jgi:hypothetical protein